MLQIKHGQSQEIVTNIFTQTTQELTFRKNREFKIPSVIQFFMVLKAPPIKAPEIRKLF